MEKIPYTVQRGVRKTLSLSVGQDGAVIVRAPLGISEEKIEEFVKFHMEWIRERVASFEESKPKITDGSVLALCGRHYLIATSARTRLTEGRVYLPAEERERALVALAKRQARQYLCTLVEEYAKKYGFTYKSVRITPARGRWGSCAQDGALSFSFRVAFLSDEQARYIVVHELCHTRHLDHSPAFWEEVEKILPDYRTTRDSLKAVSGIMLSF